MTVATYLVLCLGLLAFVVGTIARAVRYATQPVHLRWELYPVPHEAAQRAGHGGSYFEATDWWEQPQRARRTAELAAMVPEMLFLRGLWEFNPGLWRRSFPFHFGLYLVSTALVVLVAGAALGLTFAPAMSGPAGIAVRSLYRLAGASGAVLAVSGALGLLVRRLTSPDLKPYTAAGDLFNLVLFIVTVALLGLGYLLRPGDAPGALAMTEGFLAFDTTLRFPVPFAIGLWLSAGLAAYIPFTHMSHFVGKYFTYHAVRWDDRPAVSDPRTRRAVAAALTYRPTWAAPHVGADGAKTWGDVVATRPGDGVRR